MIFFIATIFIAQLIILWNVVFFLVTVDNRINLLTANVCSYNEILPELMSTVEEMTSTFKQMVELWAKKLVVKSNKFVLGKLKTLLQSLMFVSFRPKYRKVLVGIKLGIKLTKRLIKQKNML